jgi:hypothetical protein
MRTWVIGVLVIACSSACSGDAPPPSGKCTGAAYDPCNEEHECDSQLCQNFIDDGFQVCSQACDAATPCPDDAPCDDLTGMCKPAAPNDCEL